MSFFAICPIAMQQIEKKAIVGPNVYGGSPQATSAFLSAFQGTSTAFPDLVPEVGLISEWLDTFIPTWGYFLSFVFGFTSSVFTWHWETLLCSILYNLKQLHGKVVNLLNVHFVLTLDIPAMTE